MVNRPGCRASERLHPGSPGHFTRSPMNLDELAGLIKRSLKRSKAVEIDGLGTFARNQSGNILFMDSNRPRVFIAYASEDGGTAERLFKDLSARGLAPWLDRRK